MAMNDDPLKNDNFNSIHNHGDGKGSTIGWLTVSFLLSACLVLLALVLANEREQTVIIKDLKKTRMLHEAYEWENLNKELQECRE